MSNYWLDSNVFIEGEKGPYGFDIAPGFWTFLDDMVSTGRVCSSKMVYDELTEVDDALHEWAKARKSSGLFPVPDSAVQDRFRDIVNYVNMHYPAQQSSKFLGKADPWIIAHAAAYGGAVVTLETRVSNDSQKAKIPNVGDQFKVRSLNTYGMLRELGAALGGQPASKR